MQAVLDMNRSGLPGVGAGANAVRNRSQVHRVAKLSGTTTAVAPSCAARLAR